MVGSETSSGLVDSNMKQRQQRKICRYFNEGYCHFGNTCRYLHITRSVPRYSQHESQNSTLEESDVINTETSTKDKGMISFYAQHSSLSSITFKMKRLPFKPKILTISGRNSDPEIRKKFKDYEISYFKRRFPLTEVVDVGDNVAMIVFLYEVTHDDWVFDVKTLKFSLFLPIDYPIAIPILKIKQSLPSLLVDNVNKKAAVFIEEQNSKMRREDSFKCIGRDLVRWIDRSIFHLFVDGLKRTKMVMEAEEAGISLIMPDDKTSGEKSKLNEKEEIKININVPTNELIIEKHEEESTNEIPIKECDLSYDKEESNNKIDVEQNFQPSLEIRLDWKNMGNIASITSSSLAFTCKCLRCSSTSFLTSPNKKRITSVCKKCFNGHSILLIADLVHENSNILGRLDLKGCRPVDCVLLSSKLRYDCLNCARYSFVENLIYNVPYKSWCFTCHTKCEFEICSIRFAGNRGIIPKEDSNVVKPKSKKEKMQTLITIVEGQPLPMNGACEHYKKSYRWFRFPCCGKLYPCDSCHDKVETEHEMKYANRMICGFCSKEQLFDKSKPCVSCKSNVTSVKTRFWEGGKGCRNKVLMSRKDSRKHTDRSSCANQKNCKKQVKGSAEK